MSEIIWEVATVKETQQWAGISLSHKGKVQRAQNTSWKPQKTIKSLMPWKSMDKRTLYPTEQNQVEEKLTNCDAVEIFMSSEDVQHMARISQHVERQTILKKNAEVWADRPHRWQQMKNSSQHVPEQWRCQVGNTGIWHSWFKSFEVSQHQISLNCKTGDKKQQKTEMWKLKLDTGSEGNQMPIIMYEVLFL